tara:strand:- start:240 stop:434 length:195 start_codon:yes stop_codon:yes gene_type:complete
MKKIPIITYKATAGSASLIFEIPIELIIIFSELLISNKKEIIAAENAMSGIVKYMSLGKFSAVS